MKVLAQVSAVVALLLTSGTTTVFAQSITSAQDGTNTQVTAASGNPNQFNINGGTRAGANLFHSFEKFGLSKGQIANFMSNPSTRNILGRVVGGDASRINGLLQVTGGNSNLFLINPAGFIFGPNAALNVPGSFTATTASGIQIGDYWFDAMGKNNYANLVGEPNGFAFVTDNPGSIINAGKLSVPQGEQITLVGGMVINTGTLEAPGGKVTIASVPNKQLVKISQEGNLLSLGLPSSAESVLSPGVEGFTPLALPELLTGGDEPMATGVIADADGVRLTGSDAVLPTDPGTTLVAGTVDSSGVEGGTVHVLGDKVGLLGATIDASGDNRGGTVLLGGDYKGQGEVPNALRTFIDGDSLIRADALKNGPGGRVIAWADEVTGFYGEISARGGQDAGDGGFVEVSGKQNLNFQGDVDTSAPNGNFGMLLLDPTNIRIVEPDQAETNDLSLVNERGDSDLIFFDPFDPNNETTKLSKTVIEDATTNVTLAASNDITFDAPLEIDNDPEIIDGSLTITAVADNKIIVNQPIDTDEPALVNLSLSADSDIEINSTIEVTGNLKLISEQGDITIGRNDNPINLLVGLDRIGFTGEDDGSGSLTENAVIGDIQAVSGNVELFGGITISRGSSLTIKAKRFRGLVPIELSSTSYNLGVAYFGGNSSDDIGTIEPPNVQFTVQFKDENLIQPPIQESNPTNTEDLTTIDVILGEGNTFKTGDDFEPDQPGSGLIIPPILLEVVNTDGSSITGTIPFGNEPFIADLIPSSQPPTGTLTLPNNQPPTTPKLADNIQKISKSSTETENVSEETTQEPGGGPSSADDGTNDDSVVVEDFPANCSVTDAGQVQCSQAGKILALVFEPPTDSEGNVQFPISPEHFPELLTGDDDLGYAPDVETPTNSSSANLNISNQPIKLSFEKADLNLEE